MSDGFMHIHSTLSSSAFSSRVCTFAARKASFTSMLHMEQCVVEMMDAGSLVLQEQLLRKVDKEVDFKELYERVEALLGAA